MIKYHESMFSKVIIIIAIIAYIAAIYISFFKNSLNLLWLIPSFIATTIILIGVWQQEIIIDEKSITQKFGRQPFVKPKSMKWDDIDYILKDWLDDYPLYSLKTESPIKPKAIYISGIKDMNSLIVEIVKRAKYAKVDIALKELVEESKKK